MANRIRVAVIGVGRMGGRHANNLYKRRVSGAILCAVCDVSDDALNRFIGKVPTYHDYMELIDKEKPDAVVIATPHYLHGEIAKFCIECGVNVLIEKPLTVTTEEAKQVITEAAAHTELTVAVMLNQRTNPLYREARRLVTEGYLGEIRRVNFIVTDWYRSQAYYNQGGWRASFGGEGGGTLINQCVHQLDLLQWICGMPNSVYAECQTVNRNITTENDVTAIFGYGNGAKISFSASTHELRGTNRLEISGDKGRAVIERNKLVFFALKKDEKTVNTETKSGYGFVTRKKKIKRYYLRFLWDFKYGQQILILQNFVNSVTKKEKLISPVADGLNVVEMINGCYLSSWEKEEIRLPLDDENYKNKLLEHVSEEITK